jgi:hypothetical protein
MKNDNQPEYYEKRVSRFSVDALKAFEIFKCKGSFPCLPVDKNRIIFVTCKDSYRNKDRIYPYARNNNPQTYGAEFRGNNKVLMRCPSDCAIRGAAYDDGKRYNEIKERTKHIKFAQPIVTVVGYPIIQSILSWLGSIFR